MRQILIEFVFFSTGHGLFRFRSKMVYLDSVLRDESFGLLKPMFGLNNFIFGVTSKTVFLEGGRPRTILAKICWLTQLFKLYRIVCLLIDRSKSKKGGCAKVVLWEKFDFLKFTPEREELADTHRACRTTFYSNFESLKTLEYFRSA